MEKPQLGDLARDVITGFEGVVVSHTRWLTGCDTYGLAPQARGPDGQPQESQHFDEVRIEVVEHGRVRIGNAPLPGGPSSLDRHPVRR